jgi:hypothetical protein
LFHAASTDAGGSSSAGPLKKASMRAMAGAGTLPLRGATDAPAKRVQLPCCGCLLRAALGGSGARLSAGT